MFHEAAAKNSAQTSSVLVTRVCAPQHQDIAKDKTAVIERETSTFLHGLHLPPSGKHLPHDAGGKQGGRQIEDRGGNPQPEFPLRRWR